MRKDPRTRGSGVWELVSKLRAEQGEGGLNRRQQTKICPLPGPLKTIGPVIFDIALRNQQNCYKYDQICVTQLGLSKEPIKGLSLVQYDRTISYDIN